MTGKLDSPRFHLCLRHKCRQAVFNASARRFAAVLLPSRVLARPSAGIHFGDLRTPLKLSKKCKNRQNTAVDSCYNNNEVPALVVNPKLCFSTVSLDG